MRANAGMQGDVVVAEKIKHAKVGEIMDLDEVRAACSVQRTPYRLLFALREAGACLTTHLMRTQVLLLGNVNQTIIGRPFVEGAVVRARVEEQTLDEKIDIFKKKRRKNYRRWNGFRRQVTVLRVTDVVPVEVA